MVICFLVGLNVLFRFKLLINEATDYQSISSLKTQGIFALPVIRTAFVEESSEIATRCLLFANVCLLHSVEFPSLL